MKKFFSFLVVVSFVAFMPNVAKAGNILGTWAMDIAVDVYDNSGGLITTVYVSNKEPIFEQEGEIRGPLFWLEHDPATSRYTATHSTTLNNDMVTYNYNENSGMWFELNYIELYFVVIGDKLIGKGNAVNTGNYGLAGWRHDPSEPLQWDDLTGYVDFELWGYSAEADGMRSHLIFSGSRVPVPSAIFLLGFGLIGLVGLRRKFKR